MRGLTLLRVELNGELKFNTSVPILPAAGVALVGHTANNFWEIALI